MCQAFNALPRAGGILDQDCYLMTGMYLVIGAQQKREELERKRAEADRPRSRWRR